jgi:hypothetical protein
MRLGIYIALIFMLHANILTLNIKFAVKLQKFKVYVKIKLIFFYFFPMIFMFCSFMLFSS